jgi:UDP-N-acetylglucosamine transferase subunit ALG13
VIFVTVGTQLAFDRLVGAVDRWAAGSEQEVFAQIGPSAMTPEHIAYRAFVDPAECRERMRAADAIVAPAGRGTILSALELGKPLVILPRSAELGEHRNEHQLATARRFAELGSVSVAFDEHELVACLDGLDGFAAAARISPHASDALLRAVRSFIER